MMIMVNQNNIYVGGIQDDADAARYYDHIAIISQGLNAKTNFAYNGHDLEQILTMYDLNECSETISEGQEFTV
jgi:hypothetical protein